MPRRAPSTRLLSLILAATALAGFGGWLWFRDSGLARVQDVTIRGLTGSDSGTVSSALRRAARELSTLHLDRGALRDAAAPYAVVASLSAQPHPLHKLTITIRERHAIALLAGPSGAPVPVAADGVILRGVPAAANLPTVHLKAAPAANRIDDARTLTTLRLVARAPYALRLEVQNAYQDTNGLAVQLRKGPTVHFGSSDRLKAKWASLTAVLQSGQAAGATRIDVHVPERPAATGLEQRAAQIGPSTSG